MNSGRSVLAALERARQRLAEILTPESSEDFDRRIGRLLGEIDDAAIVGAVERHKGGEAAARLKETLASLRLHGGFQILSREGDTGWTVHVRSAGGTFTTEREFMNPELDQISAWILKTLERLGGEKPEAC